MAVKKTPRKKKSPNRKAKARADVRRLVGAKTGGAILRKMNAMAREGASVRQIEAAVKSDLAEASETVCLRIPIILDSPPGS